MLLVINPKINNVQTIITIKVFEQDWLDMPDEDKEYFKQLKEPEDLEIMKYRESISFDFGIDIIQHTVVKNGAFSLPVRFENAVTKLVEQTTVLLNDVTVIEFSGLSGKAYLIISNALIYSDFTAQKSGAKLYCYIYLRGNTNYGILAENVWLQEEVLRELSILHPCIEYMPVEKINIRQRSLKM